MPGEEEVTITIRVPLSRIEDEIRKKHSVLLPNATVAMADGYLIYRFGDAESSSKEPSDQANRNPRGPSAAPVAASAARVNETHVSGVLRKRRRSRRNRMRTRGWGIVAKTVNSKGQTVTIYEPFVEALRGKKLSRREQEAVVARLLRDNGNRPGRVSIDYYLDNTLEFLETGATA
jgi:hypothetical protein